MNIEDIVRIIKLTKETDDSFLFEAEIFGNKFGFALLKAGGLTVIDEKGAKLLVNFSSGNLLNNNIRKEA